MSAGKCMKPHSANRAQHFIESVVSCHFVLIPTTLGE